MKCNNKLFKHDMFLVLSAKVRNFKLYSHSAVVFRYGLLIFGLDICRLVIKTFEKSSRPRPWPPGLETKTLATRSRHQDQDLGHQVSRPRPWPPGLETKTLVIRSRDQSLIIGHKYLCMCVYMYICLYECMCVCYIHNVRMYCYVQPF